MRTQGLDGYDGYECDKVAFYQHNEVIELLLFDAQGKQYFLLMGGKNVFIAMI